MVAVTNAAAASEVRVRQILAQTGQRGYELECRSWRKRAHRTVDERIGFIFLERLPIFCFDAGNECIRIERRHRHHRENVAVVRIDNHGRGAADRAQRFLGDRLNPRVDG